MPRLPQPTAEGRQGILSLPQPSARQFGAEAFDQLSEFGRTLQDVSAKIQRRQDELDLTEADNTYRVGLDALTQSIAKEPDLSTHSTRFTQEVTALQAKTLKAYPNLSREAQQVLGSRFSTHNANATIDLAHNAQKVGVGRVLASYADMADRQIGKAATSTNLAVAADALNTVDDHRERNVRDGLMDAPHAQKDAEARQHQYWTTFAQHQPQTLLDLPGNGNDVMAMDPSKRQEYRNLAVNTIRMNNLSAAQDIAEQQRLQKERYQRTAQLLTAKHALHESDASAPRLDPLEVGQHMMNDTLDDGVGRALLGMIRERATGQDVKTNYEAYWTLFNRIHAPIGDPTRITDLAPIYEAGGVKRQLSPTDLERLRKEFVDSRDEQGQKLGTTKANFLEGFKKSIDQSNPLMGRSDTIGSVKFNEFQYFVNKEVERYVKEGKDPAVLFNPAPHNKDYLGLQAPRFYTSMQESMGHLSRKLAQSPSQTTPETGGLPSDKQRKPGETPGQYLERMKKS